MRMNLPKFNFSRICNNRYPKSANQNEKLSPNPASGIIAIIYNSSLSEYHNKQYE